jgi:hypothetical protein
VANVFNVSTVNIVAAAFFPDPQSFARDESANPCGGLVLYRWQKHFCHAAVIG